MNKRSMTISFIVFLIIGLVFLIIILLFLDKLKDVTQDTSAKATCKASVYAKFASVTKPFRTADSVFGSNEVRSDVDCPTQKITIDADLDTEAGQLSAKNKIATKMYDCLDQFGQIGDKKLELFEMKKGTDMFCVICDIVYFKEKNKEIPDFFSYLAETNAPGSEKKFLEVLSGYQTIQNIDGFKEEIKDFVKRNDVKQINTNYNYSVTFVYYKEGYLGKFKSSIRGGMIGVTVGGLLMFTGVGALPGAIIIAATTGIGGYTGYQVGASTTADWKSGVLLMPYTEKQLQGLQCSYLPARQNTNK